MDPYVKIRAGKLMEKTRAAKNQHFEPFWDDELVFNLTDETMLDLEVKNKELIHDDLIGVATISLSNWLNSNKLNFSEWITIYHREKDVGQLLLEGRFVPESSAFGGGSMTTGGAFVGTSTTSEKVVLGPVQGQQQMTMSQPMVQQVQPVMKTAPVLEPVIHTETIHIQEQPVYIRETPLVYEKEIIHEKPIITEKESVYCTQPIIIERPELREHLIERVEQPSIIKEQPIYRSEVPLNVNERPLLEGAIIDHKTETVRDQPMVFHEKPELWRKEIITEKPIIHEKDIIHVEKPIIVEKPEIIQREYNYMAPGETITEKVLIHGEKQVFATAEPILEQEPIIHEQPAELLTSNPVFVKERPDIFERQVIHEKPIIHEKDIVHTQKEIIVEKPEVFQTRIVHQEQPILRQEPLVHLRGSEVNMDPNKQNILFNPNLKGDQAPLSP